MKNNLKIAVLVGIYTILLSGCGSNPNRAGCSYVEGVGEGQYGIPAITGVRAEGDVKGAHIYVGDNMNGVSVTCNAEKQEVKYR